jgi:hypothetical protein
MLTNVEPISRCLGGTSFATWPNSHPRGFHCLLSRSLVRGQGRRNVRERVPELKIRPNIAEFSLPLNEHLQEDGATVFEHACKLGLEGIVSKRKNSRYGSGRSPHGSSRRIPIRRRCAGRLGRGEGKFMISALIAFRDSMLCELVDFCPVSAAF